MLQPSSVASMTEHIQSIAPNLTLEVAKADPAMWSYIRYGHISIKRMHFQYIKCDLYLATWSRRFSIGRRVQALTIILAIATFHGWLPAGLGAHSDDAQCLLLGTS